MKKEIGFKILALLIVAGLILTACGTPSSPDVEVAVHETVTAIMSTEMAKLATPTPTVAAQAQPVQPTQTPFVVVVTATSLFATATPGVENTPTPNSIPAATALETTKSNDWVITWLSGATKDRGDGTTFKQDAEKWTWRKIAPELWPTFPNEPNPLVPEFRVVNGKEVPDGLEFANQESNFCQQLAGESCRVPVAAEHYLYFTGDYDIPGIGACSESGTGYGCMLVIVNVGKVTSDNTGVFGQGFRIHARYWNGNALDMAIWGLTSQGSNAMMNLGSKLNPKGIQNAGANCSVPEGCKGVNVRVVFTSGNEPLLKLETTVSRP